MYFSSKNIKPPEFKKGEPNEKIEKVILEHLNINEKD